MKRTAKPNNDHQRVKDYLDMDSNLPPDVCQQIWQDGLELVSDRLNGGDTDFRGIASTLLFEYHQRNKKMGSIIVVR